MTKKVKLLNDSSLGVKNITKVKKKLNKRQRQIKKKLKNVNIKKKNNVENLNSINKSLQNKSINKLQTNSELQDFSPSKINVKNSKLNNSNKESLPNALSTEITKENFKPVIKVSELESYSANWKQLKGIITSCDKKQSNDHVPKFKKNWKQNSNREENSSKGNVDKEIGLHTKDKAILETRSATFSIKDFNNKNSRGTDFTKNSSVKIDKMDVDSFSNKSTHYIALDCEMVGGGYKGNDDILARVSVVDQNGRVLLDKYVKPSEAVTDYRTHVSGIRPEDLVNGEPYAVVQKEVSNLLRGKVVVGHALSNDFGCLLLSHPRSMIRDTSKYKPFIKLVGRGTPGLKQLTKLVLKIDIQSGEHSSVEDAQAAMQLYNLHRKEWEMLYVKNWKLKRREKKFLNNNNRNKKKKAENKI